MTDFKKYSPFQPPSNRREREAWLADRQEKIARRTRSALRRSVDFATEAFLNTLTASGDMSVFDQIPNEWMIYVDEFLIDELQGMYLSGGLTSWIQFPANSKMPKDVANRWIDVVNDNAVAYAKVAQNRMEDVGLTTWNLIKDKVSNSILRGDSVEQTKQEIERLTDFSEFRADTIARTETISAFNNGNWESDQALGEFGPTHKFWIAGGGPRARPEHLALDGTTVPMDDFFDVDGEAMLFPHAPGASAGNVVNCGCGYGVLWPGDVDPSTGEVIPGEPPFDRAEVVFEGDGEE